MGDALLQVIAAVHLTPSVVAIPPDRRAHVRVATSLLNCLAAACCQRPPMAGTANSQSIPTEAFRFNAG
jgi:hypothetical protein